MANPKSYPVNFWNIRAGAVINGRNGIRPTPEKNREEKSKGGGTL
jgi:hypothetical protein